MMGLYLAFMSAVVILAALNYGRVVYGQPPQDPTTDPRRRP